MYLGPFYVNTKEIFLILAIVLLGMAWKLGWGVSWFDKRSLFILVLLMLGTKTLLPTIHNEAFFMVAIVAIFLTFYFSMFQIIVFYFVSFALMRWLQVI